MKLYTTPTDPAKILINQKYASNSKNWVRKPCHIILDSFHYVTSQILVKNGVKKDCIHAPNINSADSRVLRKFGVNSKQMTMEKYLTRLSNKKLSLSSNRINCMWYDGMTTIGGNAKHNLYPGVAVHEFLMRNKERIRGRCFLAMTLCTRSNQVRSIRKNMKYTIITTITRLVLMEGFEIVSNEYTNYKKNMVYLAMKLRYNPEKVNRNKKMLTWKGSSSHLISFPRDYDNRKLIK